MTVKFIHLRAGIMDVSPFGGTTIAYEYNPETCDLRYAVAKCNPKEHYCKRVGRMVSTGRLNKAPHGSLLADPAKKLTPQVLLDAYRNHIL